MYGDANFQPPPAVIARVDWFDQFEPAGVAQRSTPSANSQADLPQAGDVIEGVTVEASRLPSWVTVALAAVGIYLAWRATR